MEMEELLAPAARRGRLRVRQHPAHHQGAAVRDLRPPRLVRRRHVPARCTSTRSATPTGTSRKAGQDYYLKPMNCPMHNLIFRSRGRSLPRAAAAALRVRHGLPLREVRRGARPDPRARLHPGRRAHLLHPRADGGRADRPARPSCSTCSRTTGSTTSTSSCRPRTPRSRSARRGAGRRPPRRCAEVAEASGLDLVPDPGGAAFYGPKISVQAKDAIGRTWQMSTIQLDFNLPERFELEYTAPDGSRSAR